MRTAPWFVLGFTPDDIIGGAQDERLGHACFEAWHAEGSPGAFELRQAAGTGEYFVHWYVSGESAALLDRQGVDWRGFIVGVCNAAPPRAEAVFSLGTGASL